MGRPRLTTALGVAAITSVAAGLVHAAATATHGDDTSVAVLLGVCAAAQIGWAALAVARPGRATLTAGIVVNGVAVVVWALTRTTGFVPPLDAVEPVGAQDLAGAFLGAVAAIAAAVALAGELRPRPRERRTRLDVPVLAVVSGLALVVALPAMAAGHEHGDDAHTHASEAAALEHQHAHAHAGASASATDDAPVISVDDPRLTAAQRARATDLLARTRAAMQAFPDQMSVLAAGYTWIGDGRRPGS